MRPQPQAPGGKRRSGTRVNIDISFFHDPDVIGIFTERGKVLMGLLRFHSPNRGAYPGHKRLADETGLPVRNVRRALPELEAADQIRRDGRYHGKTRYRLPVNEYNYLRGGADKWDFQSARNCAPRLRETAHPRVRDIAPPKVREIAQFPNGNSGELRVGTHKEHIKKHINTDASINEALKRKKHLAAGKGSDLPSPPPGAVFRHLPTPPQGTMFARIVWGAESILERRRVRAKHETDWDAEAQRRIERARLMKDGKL